MCFVQVMILAVSAKFDNYAEKVRCRLHDAGFEVDLERDPGLTLNKKIRTAQLDQYNFILVVGEKEEANETVNIRTRDNKVCDMIDLDLFCWRCGDYIIC